MAIRCSDSVMSRFIQSGKLLVIDLCPNGGYYHATIAHANLALQLMAKQTGAYEPTFSNDLDNLKYDRIKQFDAVYLNNTVGMLLVDQQVRDGLQAAEVFIGTPILTKLDRSSFELALKLFELGLKSRQ